MYKIVNIKPSGPVYSLRVPIISPVMGVQMSVGDILRCIHSRAAVTEILPNGEKIALNLSNYDKDNSKEVVPVEVKELEITVLDKEPVQIKKEDPIKHKIKKEVPVESIEDLKAKIQDKVQEIPKKEIVPEPIKKEIVPEIIEDLKVETKEPEQIVVTTVENTSKEDVKSIDSDPAYFKEVEKQKEKIKK